MIVREIHHDGRGYGIGMLAAVLGLVALFVIALYYHESHPLPGDPPRTVQPSPIATPAQGYCPGCGEPGAASPPPLVCYSSGDGTTTCRLVP